MSCETCGGEIIVGDWPFCGGDAAKHVPALRFGDDPLECYVDEHLDSEPILITTRGQRRAIMARNGLEMKKPRENWVAYRVTVDLGQRSR